MPFVLQIGAAVGLTGWLSIRNGQQAVNEVSGQLRREISARIEQHLDSQLATSHQINQINLELMKNDLLSDRNLNQLGAHFWRQLQMFESMGVIYYGNEAGQFIAAQRVDEDTFIFVRRDSGTAPAKVYAADSQGRFGPFDRVIPDFIDARQRPWYQAAIKAQGMTWGDIFPLQVVPRIDLPASVPLTEADGTREGVLGNNMALGSLSEFLQNLKVGQSGRTFILERSGAVVASSSLPQPFVINPDKPMGQQTERLQASASGDAVLEATTQVLQDRFGGLENIGTDQQLEELINGQRQFVEVLPYQDSWGLDWLIVIVVPESDFMAQIQANTRTTILLCLLALAVATASGILTARWLTHALLRLNRATKAIAEGDLQQTVSGGGPQEVNELAQSFNQMALQLQSSFTQLHSLNRALSESENRLTQFLEALPVGVTVHDPTGQIVYANRAGQAIIGPIARPPSAAAKLASHLRRLDSNEPYPVELSPIARALQGEMVQTEVLGLQRPERVVPLEVWATPIWDDQDRVQYAIAVFQDITARHEAEAAVRDSEARYRLLAENMSDLVCLHHLDGRYLYISPSCQTVLGYSWAELRGRNLQSFVHPEDCDRIGPSLTLAAQGKDPGPATYRMQQKSGAYRWLETLIQPIADANGQIVRLQTTSRDVTERVEAQTQLKYAALHDALTGLPNRAYLMERLEQALETVGREPQRCSALLFLDLDHFKVINDSLGHGFGDQVLRLMAQILRPFAPEGNLIARLGGDEFVLLLEPLEDFEAAVERAEQILTTLRSPWPLDGREVFVTASIGILQISASYACASDLLRDADLALYRAKNRGRSRYEIFDPHLHLQALQRLYLENDLRGALERDELVLYYQPIVDLKSSELAGFEALVRWQHPQRGLLLPGEFISIAEETGLVLPLGLAMLRSACQQMVHWQRRWPLARRLKISVNLSVKQLQDPTLVEQVRSILQETGFSGQQLTLEITESMLVGNTEAALNLLSQFKAQQIQMGIDDFGTGYSSLSYLHRLPIDVLKIDRAFVNRLDPGEQNSSNDSAHGSTIAATVMALSKSLGLITVAEGIETPQQLHQLRQMGCELGQGYLFSAAVPAEAAEALLEHGGSLSTQGSRILR
ncbi:MAG TPA: EAL domain-containing protein [Trichocoleus sp.]